ncbi:MAG TPA: tetratricopeptide repeat protein [Planctomycetota bacterium]|nr:tetratricopeptide repeat protein [Planctomycetota bacterium]
MTGQTIRWGMAFVLTAAIAAAITAAAGSAPSTSAEPTVITRDPASVGVIELELILNRIREGDLLSLKKDRTGAERAWGEARRQGEGLWPIHEGLGDSYARAKMYDLALREYRLAEERVPARFMSSKVDIAGKRAATLAASGRALEAIQAYLDLNQPGMFGSRIFGLALGNDRAACLRLIERHAEVHDARLFSLAAGLYRSMGNSVDASEALAKVAIRVEPWGEALNRQVILELREARHFDTALEVGRAWVRAVPETIEGYIAVGDVLWDAGREREALVAYSSIVDLHPADVTSRMRLGELYLRRERPDEALAQFEAGLKLQPENQDLRGRLVDALKARLSAFQQAGKAEEIVQVRRKLGRFKVQDLGMFDIKVVMTWDVKSDVDLDVYEPDGTRINHNNRMSKVGGVYLADNTSGFGPEIYTLYQATPGVYRIAAHLHNGAKSTVKVVTLLHEGAPTEERHEDTVVLESIGESPVFVRDIIIP